MFTKVAQVVVAFMAFSVLAGAQDSECNTESVQCCNDIKKADDPAVAGLLGLVGAVVQDVTAQVGVTCNPITVLGGGANSCSAQTVCCKDNSFNGVVAIGCTPINVNL
ncbi:hydrophobin [Moniliophthora roreri MCA 2997]|uniref:Hydrophobin n=2 Tax=Moniliophthora roreri TaxID=221103 RepID=V2XUC7_MONRO|nr:hydrophobin [Moniliophthora roreri MCA 2997]